MWHQVTSAVFCLLCTHTFQKLLRSRTTSFYILLWDAKKCLSKVNHYGLYTYIQSRAKAYKRLLKKPYVNGVTLREQNPHLKCCQPLQHLTYFETGFRSFNIDFIGRVGRRASKSLSIKLLEWFDCAWASWTGTERSCTHFES